MSKIMVTGITGLVGSSFAVALLREKPALKIVALVRSGNGQSARDRMEKSILEQCEFDGCRKAADKILANISVIDGDVADINAAALAADEAFKGVGRIFHCAADVNLGKDPTGKTYRINHGGTTNMIALAKALKVREFHYVSTAYVAGRLAGRAMEEQALCSGFNNPYEESKFQSELLVRNSGLPFSIYRPAIITGRLSDGRVRKPLAFYRIIEFLAKLKQNRCMKDNLNPADWVDMHLHFRTIPSEHVYFVPVDYVQKAVTALFQLPVCNRTYHVTGNSPVSTLQIERAICDILKMGSVEISERKTALDSKADDKLMSRFLGDLLPYFSSNIVFDQSNIVSALGAEFINWDFGEKGLKSIIRAFFRDFFTDIDWLQEISK